MKSVFSTKLANGSWHHQTMAERTTVRHGWAEMIEFGFREVAWEYLPQWQKWPIGTWDR